MLIFGTIGIFRRWIPLPSGLLAMLRGLIGALALLPVAGRRGAFRRKPDGKALPLLILSGAMMGFNWILLFEAYRFTSVAVATLCYYMAPVFVLLASPLLLKERLTRRKALCAALALLGMALVSGVDAGAGAGGFRGPLLALGAAMLYASVVLLNKGLSGIDPWLRTLTQLSTAGVVLLPYVLAAEDLSALTITAGTALLTLLVGAVHTGLAYALYFGSIEYISAQTAALFSYIDPIAAVLLSALILREPLGVREALGALLILGATMVGEREPNA